MTTPNALTAPKPDANLVYGDREEISALAKRIKTMLPGGDKLSDNEALALAQVATVTQLNPFIGEVWYIPGKGPMIGIKGARRMENEDTRNKNGYSWLQFDVIAPEDCGASDPSKVFRAYKCTINDVNATKAYLAVFHDALTMLQAAKSEDSYAEAKEICGPRPVWEGYGFSLVGEASRMNPDALARKRAEADALKKRIVLPFGAEISDSEPGFIEAEFTERTKNEAQLQTELGFGDTSVSDGMWDRWLKLCQKADAMSIKYPVEIRGKWNNEKLANAYANLEILVTESKNTRPTVQEPMM
jgi:hypothetical protein